MKDNNVKKARWYRNRWIRRLNYAAFCAVLFTYGLGVGHYKWQPFELIYEAKTALTAWPPQPAAEYRGEHELLQYAFTDPVNETDLYYPPIDSLAGIREANQRIFMYQERFETAYEDLQVLSADQIQRPADLEPIVRVTFLYQGRNYEAFAYGHLPSVCDNQGTASLVIPGSGLNQSMGIATGDPNNYHYGILDALNAGGGYTFIKPNEDFLAWHDGNGRKLSGNTYFNWQLNRKGSYSVSYIVQTLAFSKYIKNCFDKTIVAGLSQGAQAAFINSIQSQPDIAIISSGVTPVYELVEWAGREQILIPDYFPKIHNVVSI